MNISKRLLDPLPEHWTELEKEVRALLEKYDLKDVSRCIDMVDCERSDAFVQVALLPILVEFSSVKRIHIFYDADDVSYYRVWVETHASGDELQRIKNAQRKAEELLAQSRLEVNGWFDFVESEEKFRMHAYEGAQVAIIDRTPT